MNEFLELLRDCHGVDEIEKRLGEYRRNLLTPLQRQEEEEDARKKYAEEVLDREIAFIQGFEGHSDYSKIVRERFRLGQVEFCRKYNLL